MSRVRYKKAHILIRPLKSSDFGFIRALASKIEGYTVCPPYILWMLTRFQGQLCAVAEETGRGPVGYLLAIPVGICGDALFVWQLASTFRGQRLDAPGKMVRRLKTVVKKRGIKTIFFTTIPKSVMEVNVKSLAERVFGIAPVASHRLSKPASHGEREYRLTVTSVHKRRGS